MRRGAQLTMYSNFHDANNKSNVYSNEHSLGYVSIIAYWKSSSSLQIIVCACFAYSRHEYTSERRTCYPSRHENISGIPSSPSLIITLYASCRRRRSILRYFYEPLISLSGRRRTCYEVSTKIKNSLTRKSRFTYS